MMYQVGKGPYASEVSGIVKIGQTMTMVLGVKDDENKFDMMVRNCVAHDGQRAPIQLVDEKGCVVREKIMSPFKKVKNFDSTANVLSYAYFQVQSDDKPGERTREPRVYDVCVSGVQVPGLDERSLPVRGSGLPRPVPGARLWWSPASLLQQQRGQLRSPSSRASLQC